MADIISELPTDKIPLTEDENNLLGWLFPEKVVEDSPKELKSEPQINISTEKENQEVISKPVKTTNKKLFSISFIVIVTVTFFILNLNATNIPFETFFGKNSSFLLSLSKTTIFLIIFISTLFIMKKCT